MRSKIVALARFAWASPCSALGLVLALPVLLAGGRAVRIGSTLEVSLRSNCTELPAWLRALPFGAITLGHVVLGQSAALLAHLRPHEQVHVRQYEVWGPFFLVAYPVSSLWALVRGQCPYRANFFEQQAFSHGPRHEGAA